ncbi:MAG: NUDIX hydrolase [Halobacteriaceae archaeon]
METTRHFTASVYIVADGATALHDHHLLDGWLPPGGHVDRGEIPHEAGLREVREETGLDPTLLGEPATAVEPMGRTLPDPRYQVLYDVNVSDDGVGHQHIDHIYYATVDSRAIDPAPGEAPASDWAWFTETALREADVPSDVRRLGTEAIRVAAEEG